MRYAEQIRDEWQEFGLDSVEIVPYRVLLSYPNKTQPNYISIIDHHGKEVQAYDTIYTTYSPYRVCVCG